MDNHNGRQKTWQDVATMALTFAYRLTALYMLRELYTDHNQIIDGLTRLGALPLG